MHNNICAIQNAISIIYQYSGLWLKDYWFLNIASLHHTYIPRFLYLGTFNIRVYNMFNSSLDNKYVRTVVRNICFTSRVNHKNLT